MIDSGISNMVCFLKNSTGNNTRDIWMSLGRMGAFRTSKEDSIDLCKLLIKKDLFEYPLWLQNNVIKLLVDEADNVEKREIKDKLLNGEIFCLALTERLGGSSFQNVRTQVDKYYDDIYKANGKKAYISNGSIADDIVFLARDNNQNLNLFYTNDLSNTIRKRISLSSPMGKYDLSEIEFIGSRCQCLYPDSSVKAMFVLNKAMAIERLFCAITMLGLSKNLLNIVVQTYKEKSGMLQSSQYWKFSYARMKTNINILETYLSKLEKMYTDGKAIIPNDAAIAKSFATDTLKYVLNNAEKLMGAQCVLETNILLRYEVYSKAYCNAGGTNEIMKEIIGADL